MKRFLPYLILLLYVLPFSQKAQEEQIDSLRLVLKTAKEDTSKANILAQLVWLLINTGNYEEALTYTQDEMRLSKDWPAGQAVANNNLGYIYMSRGDFKRSLDHFNRGYQFYKTVNNKQGMSQALGSMGGIYSAMGNYAPALDHYFRALRLAEDLGMEEMVLKHQTNIGIVYMQQEDFDRSLNYLFKALHGFEKRGGVPSAFPVIGNIGVAYERKGIHSVALAYFKQALKMAELSGDKFRMVLWLENIGVAYESQGDSSIQKNNPAYAFTDRYPTALSYYTRALQTAEEIGDGMGIAADNGYLGNLYLKLKNYPLAEMYLLKAKKGVDSLGVPDLAKDQYLNLSTLYSETGKYSKALDLYKKYIALKDSVANEANTRRSVQLEMNYEFEKKEAATLLEQEKKDAIAEAEKRKQRIILLAISGLGLLVLGFALFAYRSFLQKRKANVEISRQKNLIEEKQKEILDSIHYARRIQQSLLPHEAYIRKSLHRLRKA